MPWCLFGTRASATIMMTKPVYPHEVSSDLMPVTIPDASGGHEGSLVFTGGHVLYSLAVFMCLRI